MATKEKKKNKIIPAFKIEIPFGCFLWEGRMVIDNKITPVYTIMNSSGKVISCEDKDGGLISLPLIKPNNQNNVLYSRTARAELGARYGFTKKA